jgi:hypothetical protein
MEEESPQAPMLVSTTCDWTYPYPFPSFLPGLLFQETAAASKQMDHTMDLQSSLFTKDLELGMD